MTKRIKYLDYSRGFAMILVMYAHYFTVSDAFLRKWIYSFHLPIFFIITGMLIYKKNTKFNFKNQVKRLIIPYFIFCLITSIGIAVIDIINNEPWMNDFILNIKKTVLFYGVKADWFLPCLFIALILFYFVKDNINNKSNKIILLFIIFIIPFLNLNIISVYTYKIICRSLIATIFIYSGYSLTKFIERQKVGLTKILILFLLTIICTYLLGYIDLYSLKLRDPYIYYISGIIGSIFVLFLFKYIESKNIKLRLIEFIGKNSIIFLGTHMVFGYFVKEVFKILLGNTYITENLYLNGLIILIIVIILELPFVMIYNRLKMEYIDRSKKDE